MADVGRQRVRRVLNSERRAIIQKYEKYRDGGDGLIAWAEENVKVPIYRVGSTFAEYVYLGELPEEVFPSTGRSYWGLWQEQKKIFRECLAMKNGEFIYRLIVFCWPRGEAKSFMTNLIQGWKFFCWPKQQIVLCSNSKELSSFLLFKELKSLIEQSPRLLRFIGGKKNLLEDCIRRKDKNGSIVSMIQTISSYSGIVSNINGYSFSEFFQNKSPDFFEKLDTSTRNTPNALGLIDSTVSSKDHQLYRLYQSFVKGEDKLLYFNYRFSKNGDYRDYWHPKNDQIQLDSFRTRHLMGGFARLFLNLWSAGAEKVFSQEEIEAVNFVGADGNVNCHKSVIELVRKKYEILDGDPRVERMREQGVLPDMQDSAIEVIEQRLYPVSSIYKLNRDSSGMAAMADSDALERLTEIYDTDWSIIAGIDRADPLKQQRTSARTIFTALAKGLPGSLSNPEIGLINTAATPDPLESDKDRLKRERIEKKISAEIRMPSLSYIYFLLCFADIHTHSLEGLKAMILMCEEEYDGIDVIGGERYGLWDLIPWGESRGMMTKFDLIHSNYKLQLAFFSYFCNLINSGRFKGPQTGFAGSKGGDLPQEEMSYFDHDDERKFFGSPEKKLRNGVQDDFMFAAGNGLFAGRSLGVTDFRSRRGSQFWGTMIQPGNLVGRW